MAATMFAVEILPDLSAQPTWVLWLLAGGAVVLLSVGGSWAVTGAARLATALGISKVIIGATVVSLGTTSAEVFVSVMAAFRGQGDLALGNAVGSIICDTALIFGLCCLLTRLPKNRFLLHRQGVVKLCCDSLLTVTMFALAIAQGGLLGVVMPRWVGFGFVGLLVVYLLLSVRWARRRPELLAAEVETIAGEEKVRQAEQRRPRRALLDLAMLAGGLGVVLAGSELMIRTVLILSDENHYNVGGDILAVTVVAFGTSLPEFVTAMVSLAKGHPELMVGNVIGADILNVLFVSGLSASAMPLNVPETFFKMHLPVMWASSILFAIFIFSGGATFRRWQGLPLLALYIGYLALLIATRGQV